MTIDGRQKEQTRTRPAIGTSADHPNNLTEEDLKNLREELLDINLYQLRNLIFTYECRSPGKAGKELGKDQKILSGQVDLLNEYFLNHCGEPLAKRGRRGGDYTFTPTCQQAVEFSKSVLTCWIDFLEERRRRVATRLVIATTTFTIPILAVVWDEVSSKVKKDVTLNVTQIRTKDFTDGLKSHTVDLIIGGTLLLPGMTTPTLEHDFSKWEIDGLCLLTNIQREVFKRDSISKSDLTKRPLILPSAGIIMDAMKQWFRPKELDTLNVVTRTLDVHYGIAQLKYGIVSGFMLATQSIAEMACKPSYPGGPLPLRIVTLDDTFEQIRVISGLYGRLGERDKYKEENPNHPLVIFWDVFTKHSPLLQNKSDL